MNNAVRTYATDKRNSVSFLTGLLFGTLAGFGIMLLIAPKSGKKTRAQIGLKSIELQDRVTDTYDDLVTLAHFDNRKILTESQGLAENKYMDKVFEYLPNQASPTPKTEMQKMSEELLYNDSLGG